MEQPISIAKDEDRWRLKEGDVMDWVFLGSVFAGVLLGATLDQIIEMLLRLMGRGEAKQSMQRET
jgi:hypothetical protein